MLQRLFTRTWKTVLVAVLAVTVSRSAMAQKSNDESQQQAVNLFMSDDFFAFDLAPEQQRALESFRADPAAGQIKVLRVNPNAARIGRRLNLNFAKGADFLLSMRSREDLAPGDFSWLGEDPSGARSAVFVVKDDQITGTIHDGEKLFRVRSLGGGIHAIIEVDLRKLPPEHPPGFEERERETTEPPGRSDAAKGKESGDASPHGDLSPGSCGTIDVLVAYTPAAAKEAGSISGLIELAIVETNNSYARSGINPRLRLLHQIGTDYVESGDMELDVRRLENPTDGFLDDVPRLRDERHADLAVLITARGNYCGIAADILAKADSAYAVVGQNCATGYYSFGHEIGHLQGARHNPEADTTATPFPYGHGFFSTVNRKRTVMSYDCPQGCTRIDVWANPEVIVEGVAMGDAARCHDARVVNETACRVASFR